MARILFTSLVLALSAAHALCGDTPTIQGVLGVEVPSRESFYVEYIPAKVTDSPRPNVRIMLINNGVTRWLHEITTPDDPYEAWISWSGWTTGTTNLTIYKQAAGKWNYAGLKALRVPTVPAWWDSRCRTSPLCPISTPRLWQQTTRPAYSGVLTTSRERSSWIR